LSEPTPAPRADSHPILSLRSASFGYADRVVVTGVTLDVHAGEVVAILGPNGSGKSTLVKGLLGLNDHLGGQVALFGTPMDRFRDHARLGYVPQRHTLSASVRSTATEIVATGRLPHQGWLGRSNRQDREIMAQCLDVVGLGDRAEVDVSTLSGGQQRRVLIARALASQPDVLIMDEPTAGVDLASQEVLSRVISRLAGRGVTMLIVTHEVQAVRGVLSRIVQLNGGRVTFDGTLAEHARSRGAPTSGQDGHHHDDEQTHEASPSAGPFDRIGHRDQVSQVSQIAHREQRPGGNGA